MSGAIYLAAGGALAFEKRLEIIANNLANVNTVGYKMDQGHFRFIDEVELAAQSFQLPDELVDSKANLFWMQFNMYTDHSSGNLKNTGNDVDLALVGKGFFCIQKPDGVQYTRNGEFTLNAEGVLVTHDGWKVLGEGGEIQIQSQENPLKHKKFIVDEEGNIAIDGKRVDRLRIVDFAEPYRLQKVGDTLFRPASAEVVAVAADGARVSQGFVELSNVDAVKMMTEMIEVLRGYESYQKVIRSVDETNAKAINEVGKTA
jgi:flagellar basal-body rod protein FlgG